MLLKYAWKIKLINSCFQLENYFSERLEEILHTDYERYNNGENCTFVGPGHGTPIQTNNEWYYVYHTWKYNQVGQNPPGRVMNLDKIKWLDNKWPMIGVPSDFPQET